jgi:hypothetical protein
MLRKDTIPNLERSKELIDMAMRIAKDLEDCEGADREITKVVDLYLVLAGCALTVTKGNIFE